MKSELAKTYAPREFEDRIYQNWCDKGYFTPDVNDGKLYTMCESATNKYIFGKFTSAKYCYATDLSKYSTEK